MKQILIAGATGLIGSTAVHLAIADGRFDKVISISRKPLGVDHPKLEQWCATDLLSALRPQPVDAVLCCLGTTMRNVGGDKAKFIHVDKDLVLGLASWAKSLGVPVFAVVSAIGADRASRIFYNRVKGEMEMELKAIGLPVLHIFHPSILTGPRGEQRLGERAGIAVMRLISALLPSRYKPMPHDVLAKAMLNSVFEPQGGTHLFSAINALAARS
jgi:uncharacterized protein YbjT (DUF2867 family)